MVRTQSYRDQHEHLLALAGKLGGLLAKPDEAFPAPEARHLLSEIAGKLNVHLAMEDKHLYPSLLIHADATVQSTAKRFIDEMGGIATVFKAYLADWPTPMAISQNPTKFRASTQGILQALGTRIQKENAELYALVDAQG